MKHHRGKSSGQRAPPRNELRVKVENIKDAISLLGTSCSVQRVIQNTNSVCIEIGPELGAPENLRLVAIDANDPIWQDRVTYTVLKISGGSRVVQVPYLGGAGDPQGVNGPACLARWKEQRSQELRVLPAAAQQGGNLGEVEDPQHME